MRSGPPSHWQKGNIRRFAAMKTGHTPSRSVPEYWEDATIPWFTLADVWQLRDGRQVYLGETASSISEAGLQNSAAELLPPGTVVLSRTASVGFSGVMPRPMATSQDFWNWVCGPDLLPEFLNYQFKAIAPELRALNMGSTHQTIYQKDAASITILVPPVAEQRAIVTYLDREIARVDMLIDEMRRLIELLRERRRALIGHALTPEPDWRDTRIKHVAATTLGKMLDAGRALREADQMGPYVRAADVLADGTVNLVDLNEMPFSPEEIALLDLRREDILVIEGGATVGRPGYLHADAPGIAFQKTVNRLRGGPDIDARFLYWSMLWRYEADYYNQYFGSVSFAHLTAEKLRELPLPHPPLSRQREIAADLDEQSARIDILITEANKFVELSLERRAAVIASAVAGKTHIQDVA